MRPFSWAKLADVFALQRRFQRAVAGGPPTFTGSATLAVVVPVIAANGLLSFAGSGAAAVAQPSIAASGAQTFTGAAALGVPTPSVAATGALQFSGTGTLVVTPPNIAGTGTHAAEINLVPAVGGRHTGARKRRIPDAEIVQTLTRDLLGPAPGMEVPLWYRSEQDLAELILAEHV